MDQEGGADQGHVIKRVLSSPIRSGHAFWVAASNFCAQPGLSAAKAGDARALESRILSREIRGLDEAMRITSEWVAPPAKTKDKKTP